MDEEIRTATICEPGKGPENTDLLFAFPRPRIALGLPAGFVLEASWLPPIRLKDVKSSLVGFSLARAFAVGRGPEWLALRAHGLAGLIQAPITCDEDALRDQASECFQGTRSNDKYRPNIFGLEAAISWSLAGGRAHPLLGGGFNVSQPRFQVNFTDRLGSTDSTKVRVNLSQGVLFGGITWEPAVRFGLTAAIYASPRHAVTGRLALRYTMGP